MCRARDSHRGWKTPCGVKMLSWIVQFFALLFVLVGLAVFGYGIFVMIELTNLASDIQVSTITLPIGIIVLGGVVSLLSGLICCAARRERTFMIGLTALILFCIIMAQAGITIALFVTNYSLSTVNVYRAINKNSKSGDCNCWALTYSCPASICAPANSWSCAPLDSSSPFTTYCLDSFEEQIQDNTMNIAIAAAVLFGVEICGLFALVCMCCSLRNAKDDHEARALISDSRRNRSEYKYAAAPKDDYVPSNKYNSDRFPQPTPARGQGDWAL